MRIALKLLHYCQLAILVLRVSGCLSPVKLSLFGPAAALSGMLCCSATADAQQGQGKLSLMRFALIYEYSSQTAALLPAGHICYESK